MSAMKLRVICPETSSMSLLHRSARLFANICSRHAPAYLSWHIRSPHGPSLSDLLAFRRSAFGVYDKGIGSSMPWR